MKKTFFKVLSVISWRNLVKALGILILFIWVLLLFILLVDSISMLFDKIPTPQAQKSEEVLKGAQPDDFVVCSMIDSTGKTITIRAILVQKNTGVSLSGQEIGKWFVHHRSTQALPYGKFENCDIQIYKDRVLIHQMIGSIITTGRP